MRKRIVIRTLILLLLAAVAVTGCTLAPLPAPTEAIPAQAYRQARELLSRYGWTMTGGLATHRITLPESFEHRPGEFPIPIYWAYNNELSKAIGLDLSPYPGQRVEATVYELEEDLPQFLRPYTKARAVVVTHKGKIIGAWIDKGRHYAFACSLDRKPLEEIRGMDWSEWLLASGVVNLNNEMERELAMLTPEEIIARYYEALNDRDDERAYACLTRRYLTDFLFSNMGDLALYHTDYHADPYRQRVRSVRVKGIELLPIVGNPKGVVEYKVNIDVRYEPSLHLPEFSGRHVRFVLLREEVAGAGWRIITIGTGP